MRISIQRERPDQPEVAALLRELDAHLSALYPAESCHHLRVDELLAPGVAFFVLRSAGSAAGCAALRPGDTGDYLEVKRMFVRPAYRGRGYGRMLLDHLGDHARELGCRCLRLETGVYQQAAIGLYESAGFYRIAPFGEDTDDPLSLCYEWRLAESTTR